MPPAYRVPHANLYRRTNTNRDEIDNEGLAGSRDPAKSGYPNSVCPDKHTCSPAPWGFNIIRRDLASDITVAGARKEYAANLSTVQN
jgi:hypothetical protein